MDSTSGASEEEGQELSFPAFPYQPPYGIQVGFMSALYRALERGGVGLFESPTGTGKTLSLICSSLQWLEDSRRREREAAEAAAAGTVEVGGAVSGGGGGGNSSDDEPDWMRDYEARKAQQAQLEAEAQRAARLAAVREGLAQRAAKTAKAGAAQRRQGASAEPSGDPDSEFLLEDCDSDGGGSKAGGSGRKRRRLSSGRQAPAAAGALGADSSDDGGSGDESDGGAGGRASLGEAGAVDFPKRTQVIFSSRTHSQLAQFVGELRRTPFAESMSLAALASRKALCINDAVLALGSPALINERCLELQKPGGSSKGKRGKKGRCPFLGCGSQAAATTHDRILAQPLDIEELAALGRRKSVCPYYAVRRALPEADVVLAPYSSLLVADTREALSLSLEGNVVIVDEGHNLVDAISSSHSAELTAAQAAAARAQLASYFGRFRTQLAPGNAQHLQTLASVAEALSRQMATYAAGSGGGPGGSGGSSGGGARGGGAGGGSDAERGAAAVLTVNNFLLSSGLDNINLFRLVRHAKESKVVFKVAGYAQAQQAQRAKAAAAAAAAGAATAVEVDGSSGSSMGSTGALHALVGFIQALTHADEDGRVVVGPGGASLRFALLNASAHFGQVVAAARSVVLASGTLSPIEPVLQLFPGTPREAIHHYSCGHVVGRDRLLALALGSGPSGGLLDFRHEARAAYATLDELGRLLLNVAKVVPGGVVVFFPSFSYADQVHSRWQASGVLRQLGERKRVFREPRSGLEVEALLQDYAAVIQSCSRDKAGGSKGAAASAGGSGSSGGAGGKENAGGSGGQRPQQAGGGLTGAVMLCVVGGKLSEGINFGDALGRCVVMVGMPYPNPSDPELQERLAFVDRQVQQAQQAQKAQQAQRAAGAGLGPAKGSPPQAAAGPGSSASASRQYYEDLCMKAVNQCVGRAIRHAGDYAAILLVDARYAAAAQKAQQAQRPLAGPLAKLPGWVRESLVGCGGFGEAYGQLARFFRSVEASGGCS